MRGFLLLIGDLSDLWQLFQGEVNRLERQLDRFRFSVLILTAVGESTGVERLPTMTHGKCNRIPKLNPPDDVLSLLSLGDR